MTRTRTRAGLLVAAVTATLTVVAQAPASATSATLYGEVAELADQLNTLAWPGQGTYNFYPGAKGNPTVTTSVVWGTPGSPTSYESKAKCASLYTEALKHTFSWATTSYLQAEFGSTSPFAADYYDGFVGGADHFSAKTAVSQLAQGDVIAIKYLDTAGDSGDATGHVMVVAGAPSLYNRDGNAATREWAVPVIDSTSNPHGVASTNPSSPYLSYPDNRSAGITEYSGIGRGWFFIQTTAADVPTGHWWGANENVTSQYKSVTDRPILLQAIV
jgi:hypothetical protein